MFYKFQGYGKIFSNTNKLKLLMNFLQLEVNDDESNFEKFCGFFQISSF